jgi:hypothetical protein
MKGDIAFAGFVITAEEWKALDAQSRAQLIAVATRRDSWLAAPAPEPIAERAPRPGRLAEGTGPLEIVEDTIELELDPD